MNRILTLIGCGILVAGLGACGQKGPLYMPPDDETDESVPAPEQPAEAKTTEDLDTAENLETE